jgi:hypothetical protein
VTARGEIDAPVAATGGHNVIAVVAVDGYRHWPWLSNAVSDASRAAALFKRLGFEQITEPVFDERATGKAIQELVTDDLMALGPEHSLMLFYAGHGGTRKHRLGDQEIKSGYLIAGEPWPNNSYMVGCGPLGVAGATGAGGFAAAARCTGALAGGSISVSVRLSRLPLGSQQVADGLHDDGQLQLVARVSQRRPRADPRPDVHHLSSACEMGREPVRSRSAISRRGNVTGVELSAARQACAGALRRLPRSARPCPELHRRGDDLHRMSSRR